MNRRDFLAASGVAGAASVLGLQGQAAAPGGRQFLELRKYTFATGAQRQAYDAFLKDVAIPAWNRLGIRPVGIFQEPDKESPLYVLLPHDTAEGAVTANHRLLADATFRTAGAAIVDAPKSALPFQEEECWLMRAFAGIPRVEIPVRNPGRVFQLRIYESPSLQTGQKKIEMFDEAGELKIFREVGLAPVFFGEALYGTKMPNLTYMLAFESLEEQKAAWGRFGPHPEWQKLRAMPEYADNRILRGIVNISLRPTDFSQI